MASKDKLGFFKVGLMYIGLLLSVVAVFLGSLHYFKGEKIISTVITFVLILCCYFIIDQLVRKKEELRKNSSYNRRLSFLLYSLYFLIALPLSFFTIHGLNVELNAKKEIQNSYKTVATDLDIMTSDFNNYAEQMRSQIKIELQNLMASKKISKENKDTLQTKYGINDELLASTPYDVITNNKTNDIFDKLIANQRKLNDEYSPLILASSQKIINYVSIIGSDSDFLSELETSEIISAARGPILTLTAKRFAPLDLRSHEVHAAQPVYTTWRIITGRFLFFNC